MFCMFGNFSCTSFNEQISKGLIVYDTLQNTYSNYCGIGIALSSGNQVVSSIINYNSYLYMIGFNDLSNMLICSLGFISQVDTNKMLNINYNGIKITTLNAKYENIYLVYDNNTWNITNNYLSLNT